MGLFSRKKKNKETATPVAAAQEGWTKIEDGSGNLSELIGPGGGLMSQLKPVSGTL